MKFVEDLRSKVPFNVFSIEDLEVIFPNKSAPSLLNSISRNLKSKDILKLKRGVYIFGERLIEGSISKFAIANKIYVPSYISFESALSYHGLIPEGVYVTTSACQQEKKKYFKTPLGDFSYDFIPCPIFFAGVEINDVGIKSKAHLASPLRALFDYIYLHRKSYGEVNDLEKDLRIDLAELKKQLEKVPVKDLHELAISYKKKNVINLMDLIVREFK